MKVQFPTAGWQEEIAASQHASAGISWLTAGSTLLFKHFDADEREEAAQALAFLSDHRVNKVSLVADFLGNDGLTLVLDKDEFSAFQYLHLPVISIFYLPAVAAGKRLAA